MHSLYSSPNENCSPSRPKSGHPEAYRFILSLLLYIDIHICSLGKQSTCMYNKKSHTLCGGCIVKYCVCDCLRRETKTVLQGRILNKHIKGTRHHPPSFSILFFFHIQTHIPSWQSFHPNLQYTTHFLYWMLGTSQSRSQHLHHPLLLLIDNIIDPHTITLFPFQMILHQCIMSITISIQGGIAQLIVVCMHYPTAIQYITCSPPSCCY